MKSCFSRPAVIGFYGFSSSGKTSLIFRLIGDLKKQGISIAVVKRTDKEISSEPAEKDTSGYRAAGAILTSFSSESETNFVIPSTMKLDQILERLNAIAEIDLVIVEGAYETQVSKIRLGKIPERENTKLTYNGEYLELKDFIIKMINKKEHK